MAIQLATDRPLSLTGEAQVPSVAVHPRSRRMQRRFLALVVLGVGSAGSGCDSEDDGCKEPRRKMSLTVSVDEAAPTCPPMSARELVDTRASRFEDSYFGGYGYDSGDYLAGYYSDCGRVQKDAEPTCTEVQSRSETDVQCSCTYTVTCTYNMGCCGYGRPYFDAAGAPIATTATSRPDWSRSPVVSLDRLSPAEREQLRDFWLKNAAAEHSSVAGFHRFALDLMAHGAPPELVEAAGRSAQQEVRHAIDCYTLASRYAGERLGPKRLLLGESAPVARDLAQLAAWTVRDGVIGESVAAYLAEEALEHATDPEVRRVLRTVVDDETAHADLAWKTVAWALALGGADVRQAVITAFAAMEAPPTPRRPHTPATRAHGILSAEQMDAAMHRCHNEVLRPVMASLLARELAA